jgi:hypothetical protein
MRARLERTALLLLLAAPAAAQQPAAAPAAAPATIPDSLSGRAQVTYVSGRTAYVDAGVRDGIGHGSRVVALRNGAIIAELTVKFLSSHSAACEIVSSTTPVNEYDSVRYSRLPVESTTVAKTAEMGRAPPTTLRRMGISGRVGLSYQLVNGTAGAAGSLTQPALDLNMVGLNVGGSKVSFAIDTRTRRTYSTAPDGSTSSDQMMRVYQASLTWADPASGALLTVGRQYVQALSSVSLFDGATAELVKRHWSFGGFGGTQPDPATMGYSRRIMQYGAFVQLHQSLTVTPGQPLPPRWSITLGGISSTDSGQLNRDFAFVQAFYSSQRFTLFATQEVDYNHGWKATMGQPTISPTSTFITAQLQAASFLSFYAGFDNRRNVLLYRDYISPETIFDDAYREGMWGGLSISPGGFLRFGGDARLSTGGLHGDANSYTGWISADRGMPLQGTVRLRATRYTSYSTDGWLYAGSLGISPAWRLRLQFNGGLRQETDPRLDSAGTAPQTNVQWFGADADLGISRSWYFILSVMRTTGGLESNDQAYGGLSYRF